MTQKALGTYDYIDEETDSYIPSNTNSLQKLHGAHSE